MRYIKRIVYESKTSNLEITLFLFSMVFLTEINGLDIRIFVSLFWLFRALILARTRGNSITLKPIYMKYTIFLVGIISYSLFIVLINQSYYFFAPLRYLRALLTLLTIVIYMNTTNVKPQAFVDAAINCLLIHAVIILAEMVNSNIENYISVISGYSIRSIDYRKSGLVAGYDTAGTFVNIGFVISTISLIVSNCKKYIWPSCVFAIAVFMTSRLSSVILVVILFLFSFIAKKYKRTGVSIFLAVILGVTGTAALIFLVLSMQIAPSLQETILSNVPFIQELFSKMTINYSNYDVFHVISSQISIPTGFSFFWGLAEPAGVDPGFIKTIYSIGYIGLVAVLGFYLHLFIRSTKRLKNITRPDELKFEQVCLYSSVFMLAILMFMDIKLSFLFATGTYELAIIFVVFNENLNMKI